MNVCRGVGHLMAFAYDFINSTVHTTHTSLESKYWEWGLIRIILNNGRFLSLCFIIKAASQGESQGDMQEVERNDKKKWKEPDIGSTVGTECDARLLPWPFKRRDNALDSLTHDKN